MIETGITLTLECSPALELRQNLECSLMQGLVIKQKLRLSLVLYENREEICVKLYKNALKKGNVKQYQGHGMTFEFALVCKKDVPEHIYEQTGYAFSHCLMKSQNILFGSDKYAMAKGSWLLFVIYDMYEKTLPDKAIEYAAIHERGEMVTLGDHNLASKLEFAIAAKENNLRWYMKWIEENCPAKFADVFSYQVHLDLPTNDELQQLLEIFQSSNEAQYVQTMIQEFEWPYTILQHLNKYKKANDEVIKIINKTLQNAETHASEFSLTVLEIANKVKQTVETGLQEITNKNLKKYISIVRINDIWRNNLIEIDRRFARTLSRKQQVMNQYDYTAELTKLNIKDSLPHDGKLSLDFNKVLALL